MRGLAHSPQLGKTQVSSPSQRHRKRQIINGTKTCQKSQIKSKLLTSSAPPPSSPPPGGWGGGSRRQSLVPPSRAVKTRKPGIQVPPQPHRIGKGTQVSEPLAHPPRPDRTGERTQASGSPAPPPRQELETTQASGIHLRPHWLPRTPPPGQGVTVGRDRDRGRLGPSDSGAVRGGRRNQLLPGSNRSHCVGAGPGIGAHAAGAGRESRIEAGSGKVQGVGDWDWGKACWGGVRDGRELRRDRGAGPGRVSPSSRRRPRSMPAQRHDLSGTLSE